MFSISKDSVIYIKCAPSYFTGGTLLLHQLGDWLQQKGFKVKMHYIPNTLDPVHEEFTKYNLDRVSEIKDDKKSFIIIPEVFPFELERYQHATCILWWLSVDNYFMPFNKLSRKRRIYNWVIGKQRVYKKAQIHLSQSNYAQTFLKRKGIKSVMLSDYLHESFTSIVFKIQNRRNLVLYNPQKGIEFTKILISLAPDIQWTPIINKTPQEVKELMLSSKIYIDFGNHPGKDRIPREAAICGCCVITGMRGSAFNHIDIPILSAYKFDETEGPNQVITKIRFVLKNYESAQNDFQSYRDQIKCEKEEFFKQASTIFTHS